MNVSFAPLRPDATEYLSRQIGIDYRAHAPFAAPRWLCATARDDDGGIAGVFLAEFVNGFEAHFNAAVAHPRCISGRLLRAVFTALFAKAVRLTALIDPANERAMSNAVRLGFVLEGCSRLGINGDRDAYTFGMLRSDCRFLIQMPPRQSLSDLRYGRPINSVSNSDFLVRASCFPNGKDFISGELGTSVPLSLSKSPVQNPVSMVFFGGSPPQMPPVDAAMNSAIVSGFMPKGGR